MHDGPWGGEPHLSQNAGVSSWCAQVRYTVPATRMGVCGSAPRPLCKPVGLIMLRDALRLDPDHIIDAEVCIIGAGPAGISIAIELMNSGLSVALIESGGAEPRALTSSLGVPAADSDFPDSRKVWTTRQYGGNANAWKMYTGFPRRGVRLIPLSAADFEQRPGVSDTGWPISRADLNPYYVRAQLAFKLLPIGYNPESWARKEALPFPIVDSDIRNEVFQFGDASTFLGAYRTEIVTSKSVTLYLNATALEIISDPINNVARSVRLASSAGRELSCEAHTFVIATGGLAAPQLLLSSTRNHQNGIGNKHGMVGRYFMDHPLLLGGDLIPKPAVSQFGFYDVRTVLDTPVMGLLRIADQALRRDSLANVSALLFPRTNMCARRERGYKAAQRIRAQLKGTLPRVNRSNWLDLVYGLDGVAQQYYDRLIAPKSNLKVGGWSRLPRQNTRFSYFEVLHQAEQFPHYENRVELSDEFDALGSRRIRINWRWHEDDRQALIRSQQVFRREMLKHGLGEFRPVSPLQIKTASTAHYMGTTRMHQSALRGVVDSRCRVHGMGNLYLASASVFPSGGFANPTLTTVALAIRVADDIKRKHQTRIKARAMAFA